MIFDHHYILNQNQHTKSKTRKLKSAEEIGVVRMVAKSQKVIGIPMIVFQMILTKEKKTLYFINYNFFFVSFQFFSRSIAISFRKRLLSMHS